MLYELCETLQSVTLLKVKNWYKREQLLEVTNRAMTKLLCPQTWGIIVDINGKNIAKTTEN